MSFKQTYNFITKHPLNRKKKVKALTRFLKWQVGIRLNPYPVVYPYGEKSRLIVWKGLTGATGNIYCGLHEFEDMTFLLHFLRKDDLFVDIGANIGSYTILSASEVGTKTISIEPLPQTFDTLKTNIGLNKVSDNVRALNVGLGREEGVLKFTKSFDTVNHVATKDEKDTIDVPVEKLDNIVSMDKPTLIKMDVEGYETEVLAGMHNTLSNPNLKAIIIELNGSGERYGYDESKIHEHLLTLDFKPFIYAPFERKIKALETYGNHNTIYIRDVDFIEKRIASARKFTILENEL